MKAKKISIIIAPNGYPDNSVSITNSESDISANTIFNSKEELLGIIIDYIIKEVWTIEQ